MGFKCGKGAIFAVISFVNLIHLPPLPLCGGFIKLKLAFPFRPRTLFFQGPFDLPGFRLIRTQDSFTYGHIQRVFLQAEII